MLPTRIFDSHTHTHKPAASRTIDEMLVVEQKRQLRLTQVEAKVPSLRRVPLQPLVHPHVQAEQVRLQQVGPNGVCSREAGANEARLQHCAVAVGTHGERDDELTSRIAQTDELNRLNGLHAHAQIKGWWGVIACRIT